MNIYSIIKYTTFVNWERNVFYLKTVANTLNQLDPEPIQKAVNILKYVRNVKKTVWLAGNGGSASTASHFSNDLMKMGGVKAICLSDMTPLTTAFGNDCGWEVMFSMPIVSLPNPDDVVIAFSCSGNSKNITSLLSTFLGTKILFTGNDGGHAKKYAKTVIHVPHPDIKVQEDCHLAICHYIAGELKDE